MQPEPSEKTSLVGKRQGELEGLKRSFRAEITEGELAFWGEGAAPQRRGHGKGTGAGRNNGHMGEGRFDWR